MLNVKRGAVLNKNSIRWQRWCFHYIHLQNHMEIASIQVSFKIYAVKVPNYIRASKNQCVLYFRKAGGSRISKMTLTSHVVMTKTIKAKTKTKHVLQTPNPIQTCHFHPKHST